MRRKVVDNPVDVTVSCVVPFLDVTDLSNMRGVKRGLKIFQEVLPRQRVGFPLSASVTRSLVQSVWVL